MIVVTRLNGQAFALNPDLVERAESNPDTVITLVDGTKYVVAESVPQIVARVRDYRASVISAAQDLEDARRDEQPPQRPSDAPRPTVVPLPVREA